MKTNAFSSIVTLNYLSYAKALGESLKVGGNHEPYYTLVVDYRPEYAGLVKEMGINMVTLEDLQIPNVDELLEKYQAFEFANVMKPFFANWLLKNHPEINYLVYLDSDIQVYAPFTDLFKYLDDHAEVSVALMPHLVSPEVIAEYIKRTDYYIEQHHFAFGIYNAGILIYKNDARAEKFNDWHASRLLRYGFNMPEIDMFTDQKSLDMSTIAFDFVGVYRNTGYNLAPWNYTHGILREEKGKYVTNQGPLVFFHFSRVHREDPAGSLLFTVSQEDEAIYHDLINGYRALLKASGVEKTRPIPYGFKDRYERKPIPVKPLLPSASAELHETRRWLEVIAKERDALKPELNRLHHEHHTKLLELAETQAELHKVRGELNYVYASRSWKFVTYVRYAFMKFVPSEQLRRKIILVVWSVFKNLRNFYSAVKFFLLSKPVVESRKRKINHDSKKIIIVGHSYHAKTQSTKFLIDQLKESFEVEVLLEESWMGKGFPDLSFIDHSYLGVVFIQLLPPMEILSRINNDNIIFFPMYDAAKDWSAAFWRQLSNLKIVSFSKTLHDKLKSWGVDSLYLQYFPQSHEFSAGDPKKVFFWQRRTEIGFEQIKKLFTGMNVSIHIHKALDPYQEFIQPSPQDEKKFNITYSDWFETKEEMWNKVKECAVYVAPREFEGIGMSFLEAMAMGKAVVAVNNPTMNEYIHDRVTGYLFDLNKIHNIDVSNIAEVQKNTHEFMHNGQKEWVASKVRIFDFIRNPWIKEQDAYTKIDELKELRKKHSNEFPNYENELRKSYSTFIHKGDVVIDIGAHLGIHLNNFIQLVGKEGFVFGFEPLPTQFASLQKNYGTRKNVVLVNKALLDKTGQDSFWEVEGSPEESGFVKREPYFDPANAHPKQIRVLVDKLDNYLEQLPKVDFIKIDTEGAELKVLAGAEQILSKHRPVISIEYGYDSYKLYGMTNESLVEFTRKYHYFLSDLWGNMITDIKSWENSYNGVYWDVFLVPDEKIDFFQEQLKSRRENTEIMFSVLSK